MLTWKERAVNDTKNIVIYKIIILFDWNSKVSVKKHIGTCSCDDDKFTMNHFHNVSSRPTLYATCVYLYEFQKSQSDW